MATKREKEQLADLFTQAIVFSHCKALGPEDRASKSAAVSAYFRVVDVIGLDPDALTEAAYQWAAVYCKGYKAHCVPGCTACRRLYAQLLDLDLVLG